MIFISGATSIIIQEITLCPNKVRVIYFCPKCVNFLPENVFFGAGGGGGGGGATAPCHAPAPAPMVTNKLLDNFGLNIVNTKHDITSP